MEAIYCQKGDIIDYTAAGALAFGDVVDLTTRIGVAGVDIPEGGTGPVHLTGVYQIPKATGEITVGQALYWAQGRQEPHHRRRQQHPGGLGGGPCRE